MIGLSSNIYPDILREIWKFPTYVFIESSKRIFRNICSFSWLNPVFSTFPCCFLEKMFSSKPERAIQFNERLQATSQTKSTQLIRLLKQPFPKWRMLVTVIIMGLNPLAIILLLLQCRGLYSYVNNLLLAQGKT